MTRAQIQTKITQLIQDNPNKDRTFITDLFSTYLDTQQLGYEGLTQDLIKGQILSDLDSYDWGVI